MLDVQVLTGGKCAGMPPEFFFPEVPNQKPGRKPKDPEKLAKRITLDTVQEEAAKVCLGTYDNKPCRIKDECLQYAIDNYQNEGVWGGMTEKERARYKKQLQLAS